MARFWGDRQEAMGEQRAEETGAPTLAGRKAFGATFLGAGVLLVAMGLIWGATFSFAKIAIDGGAHPIGLTFWQGLGGGVFLLLLTLARRRFPPFNRQALTFYVVCGVIGSTFPSLALFFAAGHLPAGVLSISIAVVPLVTYGLSALLRLESLRGLRLLGLLLGIAAVALLVLPGGSLPTPGAAPWVLLAVASAACYAGENVYIALRAPPGVDALTLTTGMLLTAAVMIWPAVLAFDAFVPLAWPWGLAWGAVEWAIVGSFLGSALAYAMFLYLVSVAGPVFASQTAYTVTLCGVLWGMVLLDERHSVWIWGALALMMAGLALVKPRKTAP